MARMTPPLLTKGRYTLVNPFVAEDTVLYTCTALRTFAECEVAGENVLQDVYLKHNLTEREYNRDLDAGALLVTLMSETQPPIFVPDTYIESYPNLSDVVYNHVVLTVSLGSVPDFLNFDFLKAQMAALVSDVIGVTPEVQLARAISSGIVTPEQHEAMEVGRQAAIKLRTTDRAKNVELQNKCTRLEEQNKILVELLQQHNIIPM